MEIEKIIYELLEKRGIREESDIEEFLSDKPKKTYDPMLLSDMEAGVKLIMSEAAKGSRICIYGDYDADGITSTALMISVLSHLTNPKNIMYYIPSRFDEGYGLNMDAVKLIKDRGVDFIITVDCGSVSKDEVEYAKELGMRILVTDHHSVTDTQADCLLINPKKPGDTYPFRELSGCGVAFKVASCLQKKAGLPKSVLSDVLDLVAIGTIGDIMPLVDENRTMVKYGLRAINSKPRPGLKRLIEDTGLKMGEVVSENLAFGIVPHLNAAGRIKDASQCVRLLVSGSNESDMGAIDDIVHDIIFKNQERKRIQSEIYDKAIEIMTGEIGDIPDEDNLPVFIILRIDDAHEGIIGIVAGKLKEAYNRPVIIVTQSGEQGRLKGTGRSIHGANLYEMLKVHDEMFVKFGGHAAACGFTIDEDKFEKLKKELIFDMARRVIDKPDIFKHEIKADLDLEISDVDLRLIDNIELLQPFGNANPKPEFLIRDVSLRDVRFMGTENQHVRFMAVDDEGNRLQCVLFNHGGRLEKFSVEDTVDIYGKLDASVWMGNRRIQFKVDEIVAGW